MYIYMYIYIYIYQALEFRLLRRRVIASWDGRETQLDSVDSISPAAPGRVGWAVETGQASRSEPLHASAPLPRRGLYP